MHPDKGGRKEDTERLQAAKENWEKVLKGSSPKGGRPQATAGDGALVSQRKGKERKEYRVHSTVVLLTP